MEMPSAEIRRPSADDRILHAKGNPDLQPLTGKRRRWVILSTLLALFLGALDTLVMSAAMPTIVSELGALHLYSWVFSAYLLSRAVALPVFGKLSDLFTNKRLYAVSILIFMAGSVWAALADSMVQLTAARVIQGIGAGGNFALVYIVLSDISEPEHRGKMMAMASFVWGLASVFGPTFGGFIVTYASWRWIFWINLPLGVFSLVGILRFLEETRDKRAEIVIDYAGIALMTTSVLALLLAFMLGGRDYAWTSPRVAGLLLIAAATGVGFYHAEKKAREPILSMDFFKVRGFSIGNAAVFCSSFSIFALAAYSPLYIQGALGMTPGQLGVAMVFLSLGWSVGALYCGRKVRQGRERPYALAGGLFLIVGAGMTVRFTPATGLFFCSLAVGLAGIGMGLVSIATLLIVQNSISSANLGVTTSSHQFTRTLGGTIGIGICGGIVTNRFGRVMDILPESVNGEAIPESVAVMIRQNFENLFRPEIQAALSPELRKALHAAMGQAVIQVFWVALAVAVICFLLSVMLPETARPKSPTGRS